MALREGWAEPAFSDELEKGPSGLPSRFAPVLLLGRRVLRERGGPAADEALRSPLVLSVSNNRSVHAALEQLNRLGVRLEPGWSSRYSTRRSRARKPGPGPGCFGPALRMLAASDPDGAARLAETHVDRPESPHHREAVKFLRESAGLPMPYAVEPPAVMALTDAERGLLEDLVDCWLVYAEVCNGGLSQYFFNSSGDEWPRHVEALCAIGFEEGAAAIEDAARLIHPDGANLKR